MRCDMCRHSATPHYIFARSSDDDVLVPEGVFARTKKGETKSRARFDASVTRRRTTNDTRRRPNDARRTNERRTDAPAVNERTTRAVSSRDGSRDCMVRSAISSPRLGMDARTLWRARTTALFMSCERDVFGDLESSIIMREVDESRAWERYVVKTTPDFHLPYVARRALGVEASSGKGGGSKRKGCVDTFEEFETEMVQSTAPYLYEASLKSYSTFLSPLNSVIEGVVRCKSVDAESCELSVKLTCSVRITGVGSMIERIMVNKIKSKFELYPKVVELYKEKLREREREREARRALAERERRSRETIDDDDASDYQSVRSESHEDDDEDTPGQRPTAAVPVIPLGSDVRGTPACCVPSRRRSSSALVAY